MRLPLSMYVVESKHNDEPILFNTVTRRYLPIDAPNDDLVKFHFVKGSEEDAIWSQLTRPQQKAAFTVITTWECNLRCTHCTVTHKLLKEDPIEMDVSATASFLEKFQTFYNLPRMMLTFLGGEPLLRPQAILDCMDQTKHLNPFYGITTNLTVPIEGQVLEIMRRLSSIGISIDGTESIHNEQRRPLTLTTDPFWTTINNLKTLIKAGMRDKINVQGAIPDKYLTLEHRRDFYRLMLKLGIPYKQIRYSCHHPTVKRPEPNPAFHNALKSTELHGQICCKYRYYNFVLDRDGSIFADYYTWEKVGSITDPIEKIDANAKKTMSAMPALHDPTCRTCPAIGYCWGGCTNGEVVVGDSPSKYCDQAGLIKAIQDHAEKGLLTGGTINDYGS